MSDDRWRRGMISVSLAADIASILLDRPKKLNALSRAFWDDMVLVLEEVLDAGARVVVLAGAGETAFCAGGDIASFAALTTDAERHAFQVAAMRTFTALETLRIPTIAAVHGYAMGGGCELAMACDIVIAATDATFALPEARFGLVPGYGAIRGPAVIGAAMTKLMVYAGERIDAAAALRCGLCQRVVPNADLLTDANRIAAAIAAAPPEALAVGRRLMDLATDPASVARSIDEIAALHATPASRHAVAAFAGLAPDQPQ